MLHLSSDALLHAQYAHMHTGNQVSRRNQVLESTFKYCCHLLQWIPVIQENLHMGLCQ